MNRQYQIRQTSAFCDSGGELNPTRFSVDLRVDGGPVVSIGEHATRTCAESHVRDHQARLMPMEGGAFRPYECSDPNCLAAFAG